MEVLLPDVLADDGTRSPDAPWTVTLLAASSVVVAAATVHLAFPPARPWLVDEGAVMENVSAAFAFLAAAAGAWICLREPARLWPYGAIPALGAALLLDEISFGHIFLGYAPPVLHGTEIESVHELAHPIVDLLVAHPLPGVLALGAGAALTLVPGVRRRLARAGRGAVGFLETHAPFRPVALAVGLGVLALALDLDAAERLIFVEELLELLAAMALATAALCIPEPGVPATRLSWNRIAYRPSFLALAAACVAIAAVAGILFGVE
jgi:hypothetical protein